MLIKFTSITLIALSLSVQASERPKWVNNPGLKCRAYQICAVGDAAGRMASEARAREEISKFFQTKINSSLTINSSSKSELSGDMPLGSISEDTVGSINETVDDVLSGVEIKETYEGEEDYFSFAVLNKEKAASKFLNRMKEVDKRNRALFKDGRRSSLAKIMKKFPIINSLNDKYDVLTGKRFTPGTSFKKVLNKKRVKAKEGKKILLNMIYPFEAKLIRANLLNEIVQSDFEVTKNAGSASYIINAGLRSVKEYFNVKGFVRYRYELSVKANLPKGETIGSFNYLTIQTGRSQKQAFLNARPGIIQAITQKTELLDLE